MDALMPKVATIVPGTELASIPTYILLPTEYLPARKLLIILAQCSETHRTRASPTPTLRIRYGMEVTGCTR